MILLFSCLIRVLCGTSVLLSAHAGGFYMGVALHISVLLSGVLCDTSVLLSALTGGFYMGVSF